MSATEPLAFRPIVEWLERLSICVRPEFSDPEEASLDAQFWLEHPRGLSRILGLRFPAELLNSGADLNLLTQVSSTERVDIAPKVQNSPQKTFGINPRGYWYRDGPSIVIYKSISRYLRRHVCQESEYWIQEFIRHGNGVKIIDIIRSDDQAKLAFVEMVWMQSIEQMVYERRWPYRITVTNAGWRVLGYIKIDGVLPCNSGPSAKLKLSKPELKWIEANAAADYFLELWEIAIRHVEDCIGNGVADWRVGCLKTKNISRWLCFNSTSDNGKNQLHFVNPNGFRRRIPRVVRLEKIERTNLWNRQKSEKLGVFKEKYTGLALTWTHLKGWHMADSLTPTDSFKSVRIFGFPGYSLKAWQFIVEGQCVLRLIDINLQIAGDSYSEVFRAARDCIAQYIKINPTLSLPIPVGNSFNHTRNWLNEETKYVDDMIVTLKSKKNGFFKYANDLYLFASSLQRLNSGHLHRQEKD